MSWVTAECGLESPIMALSMVGTGVVVVAARSRAAGTGVSWMGRAEAAVGRGTRGPEQPG